LKTGGEQIPDTVEPTGACEAIIPADQFQKRKDHMKFIKGLAISMACWGIVFPHSQVMAAGPQPAAKTTSKVQAPTVTDVALGVGGTFTGQVVDSQGRGLDGAAVSVRQGGREVAQTVTSKDGFFSVTNLRGGTYDVVAGQGQGTYRLWSTNAAPPAAKNQVFIVSNSQVARGQWLNCPGPGVDAVTLALLGTAITGMVLGIVNYNRLRDIEDKVDRIPSSP
jgi:hypothetical protein